MTYIGIHFTLHKSSYYNGNWEFPKTDRVKGDRDLLGRGNTGPVVVYTGCCRYSPYRILM